MSLVLEIEFLTGVCRAAREPASDEPDWPPQPDRVFSALISAWAARGQQQEERTALEWLEKQAPPVVHASGYAARTAPDVFVPPNDLKFSKAEKTYIKVMPDRRPRQPRRFPVARPEDPVMTMVWAQEPEPRRFAALKAVARDIGYVGHSASLVRCRFLRGGAEAQGHPAMRARRRVYPGRLAELEQAHLMNPIRPMISPGSAVPAGLPSLPPAFSSDWLILETIGGAVPDIRASALVCRVLRKALMCGYRRIGRADAIPEIVSGHDPSGRPTRLPHLAITPMAFAGFPYSDGRVFGFALISPARTTLSDVPGFRAAFEKVAPRDPGEERRVLTLEGAPLREPLRLSPAGATTKRSLSPDPYVAAANVWASVTPIVLDRHLKRKDDLELRELVASACENAGLSRPDPDRIRIGKHSAVEGAPPARPLAGEPHWTRWKIPAPLASRPLLHAVIDFGRETPGPVMLGAGRFTGLGLCRGLRG